MAKESDDIFTDVDEPMTPSGNAYDDPDRYDDDKVKRSDVIRRQMAFTRERMDQTLDELQERISPRELVHAGFESLREHAGDLGHKAACIMRSNPGPLALIGAGLVWLIINQSRQARATAEPEDEVESVDLYVQYEEDVILDPIV